MRDWLSITAFLLAVISSFNRGYVVPVLGLLLAILVVWSKDAGILKSALRWGFVLVLLFAAAISGGMVAWASGVNKGIHVALNLMIRLQILWLGTGLLAREISSEKLIEAAHRFGIPYAGLVAGLALNVLPVLISRSRDVFRAQRLRYGKKWWRGWEQTFELLLAHTAHLADGAAAAATLRGHRCLLETRAAPKPPGVPVIVFTGKPGTGKTSTLLQCLKILKSENHKICGLIQPGIFNKGKKTGFKIMDLRTGEETAFATRVSGGKGQHGTRFIFHKTGAELAAKALNTDMHDSILIVDELGPVELRGDGHFTAVARCLNDTNLICAVLVVRRHLVPALLETLSAADATIFDIEITENPPEELARRINEKIM
jgi:nucleoside-triphosphatase THEP1